MTESYFNKKTVTKNVITTTLPRLAVPCSRTERTTMLKIQCMRNYFWRHMYMHVCNIYAHITKSIYNFISLLHPIHTDRLRHIWYLCKYKQTVDGVKQIQPNWNWGSHGMGHQLKLLMTDYIKLWAPNRLY